jgi:hypothetical protein
MSGSHDRDVGISVPCQGVARMTLTFRMLDAVRHRLWLVTGADKAAALRKSWSGDASVPAGRVVRDSAFVFTDSAAVLKLPAEIRSPTEADLRKNGLARLRSQHCLRRYYGAL